MGQRGVGVQASGYSFPGFPKISSFRGEPMHPLTDGFVHSTSDSDRSPQPTGTRRLYQSNYRRSKTYWPGRLVMLAFY